MACDGINPYWVGRGRVALHTATGLKRRRRKGLEPSRRLSETTRPRSPSASRVVVPATEVIKCGTLHTLRTGAGARVGLFRQRTSAAAPVPLSSGTPRTCYRNAGIGSASAGTTADGRANAGARRSRRGRARRTPLRPRRERWLPDRGSGAGSARRAVRGCRCGAARAAAPDRDGEEDGRRRRIGTARCRSRSQAGQRWTGMPSFMAFSTRLSVMPGPGNATMPFGRRFSSSSLRRKGAARPWVFQFGL